MKKIQILLLACITLTCISCSEDEEKSSSNRILSFQFTPSNNEELTEPSEWIIDDDLGSIHVTLPFHVSKTSLIPSIEVSGGAQVTPGSEVQQNFTSPVDYVITAEDGSTKTYTVTVANKVTPTIEGITPAAGSFDMEVTLSGANFSSDPNELTVLFDGLEAEIISLSEDEIVVQVPRGGSTGNISLLMDGGAVTGPLFTYYNIHVVGEKNAVATIWQNGVETTLSGSGGLVPMDIAGSENNIYVVGMKQSPLTSFFASGIWKNNVFTPYSDGTIVSYATAVIADNGNTFVAGSQGTLPQTNLPMYWKNDEVVTVDGGDYLYGEPRAIAASVSDVYMGGYLMDNSGLHAALWKNGVLEILAPDLIVNDIQVSGADVHVVASGDGPLNDPLPLTYWKNGVEQEITDGSIRTIAKSLYIDGNDVYIGGLEYFNGADAGQAKIWKNGVGENVFETPTESIIIKIAVINGHVISVGFRRDGNDRLFYTFDDQIITFTDSEVNSSASGVDIY